MILLLAGLFSTRKSRIWPAHRENVMAFAIVAPFVFPIAMGLIRTGALREAWEWLNANVFF
ncbi:MAG: hypothetical protein L0211_21515 [Planctomycetaceae bacterium]|nr:hypothetical protein [Planctomycetaceae bacterium]